MRSVVLAAAVLALAGCATQKVASAPTAQPASFAQTTTPSRRDAAKKILPSSVRLFVDDEGQPKRSATGVAIASSATSSGSSSFVVTNAHLLDTTGMKSPRLRVVVDQQGESFEYEGTLAAVGAVPEMDLAVIELPGVMLEPAQLADDSEIETGDDVLVVSAPYGRALTLSGGMVSNVELDPKLHVPRSMKTDAAVAYGTSGGGVFSVRTGKLLGIVEGYKTMPVGFAIQNQPYSFELPMPGETFAVPATRVRAFLEAKGLAGLLRSSVKRAATRE